MHPAITLSALKALKPCSDRYGAVSAALSQHGDAPITARQAVRAAAGDAARAAARDAAWAAARDAAWAAEDAAWAAGDAAWAARDAAGAAEEAWQLQRLVLWLTDEPADWPLPASKQEAA